MKSNISNILMHNCNASSSGWIVGF